MKITPSSGALRSFRGTWTKALAKGTVMRVINSYPEDARGTRRGRALGSLVVKALLAANSVATLLSLNPSTKGRE